MSTYFLCLFRMLSVALLLSFLFWSYCLALQSTKKGTLTGVVLEDGTESPLPFASMSIYDIADSLVTGGLSNNEGIFLINIPIGQFYALVEFMGYEAYKSEPFTISKESPSHDLGQISIKATAGDLEEIVVRGEKTIMELSLDKRIFNVGKDLANAGGNASDILMNLPSIAVDPEGNVSLRGSSNVRILIDGKPSGLGGIGKFKYHPQAG
ncbi:carboxypeptidase-like regulatory domain-containing protein [Algoriphagus antarcticus]|uniref:Carboxypeptidase-like protein n=1 Tax=Algoriphagus antarcticus TaxID=238540 RepID=A0A3E0DP76_9BACT|nr:carboxypeptidase-like regulatory domain-containing protein [Algoriphagus antarcticus]REG84740.1 hypothetical protein C8N25_11489 [Algoriphagus antarcticus]